MRQEILLVVVLPAFGLHLHLMVYALRQLRREIPERKDDVPPD